MFFQLLYTWQALVGAALGAMSPFVLWWIADIRRKKQENFDNLYYTYRQIIYQINSLIDIEKSIHDFCDIKVKKLIEQVKNESFGSYSISTAFFPLFSTIPIHDEINKVSTGSNYIDNKIAKVQQISQDMPMIMKDLRRQFHWIIEINKNFAIQKINSPEAQKKDYIFNLESFLHFIEDDIFQKNFPVYLKVLLQTKVALELLIKKKNLKWQLKFNPKYKFFWKKDDYQNAIDQSYESIEAYFSVQVNKELVEIEKNKQPPKKIV